MQIQLSDSDLQQAVRTFVIEQGLSLSVAQIQWVMGRKGGGLTANITLSQKPPTGIASDASPAQTVLTQSPATPATPADAKEKKAKKKAAKAAPKQVEKSVLPADAMPVDSPEALAKAHAEDVAQDEALEAEVAAEVEMAAEQAAEQAAEAPAATNVTDKKADGTPLFGGAPQAEVVADEPVEEEETPPKATASLFG